MEAVNRRPAAIILVTLAASLGQAAEKAPKGRMDDAQAEALARQAMASDDEKFQRAALAQLEAHHFKSTLARERETVLFAQGLIQDRLGDTARAAAAVQRAFDPDKINYAVYGDLVPHLHYHIVPKYRDGACWGKPFELNPPDKTLLGDEG